MERLFLPSYSMQHNVNMLRLAPLYAVLVLPLRFVSTIDGLKISMGGRGFFGHFASITPRMHSIFWFWPIRYLTWDSSSDNLASSHFMVLSSLNVKIWIGLQYLAVISHLCVSSKQASELWCWSYESFWLEMDITSKYINQMAFINEAVGFLMMMMMMVTRLGFLAQLDESKWPTILPWMCLGICRKLTCPKLQGISWRRQLNRFHSIMFYRHQALDSEALLLCRLLLEEAIKRRIISSLPSLTTWCNNHWHCNC